MGPGPRLRECCRQGQAEVAPNLGNHLLAEPCIKYSLARRRLDNIAEKWGRVSQKCYKFLYVIREWIISARKCVRPTTARTTTATSITIGGPTIIGTMIAKKVADCSTTQLSPFTKKNLSKGSQRKFYHPKLRIRHPKM